MLILEIFTVVKIIVKRVYGRGLPKLPKIIPVADVFRIKPVNPLTVLFKFLLHGQKDCVIFSRHLIYILKQERFRTFRLAGGCLNLERFGALGPAKG
jgi:hypothetical protein